MGTTRRILLSGIVITVDIFNLDPWQSFAIGDMVQQPATGHIGVLIEREAGRTGYWIVEWILGPRGNLLKKRVQTYEYDKTLKLYAKAAEA